MSGFNFAIQRFAGERREDTVIGEQHFANGDFCSQCKPWSSSGEKTLAAYKARYNYVTGRRGRISYRDFYLCEEHGKKFIAKHGLLRSEGENSHG